MPRISRLGLHPALLGSTRSATRANAQSEDATGRRLGDRPAARPRPPGAFGDGRRLLRLVPIEDALGAVELAGHVIGVAVDLPGRAPQRVVGDVRSKHAPLDAGGLDDVPYRLIVPVEVVREADEIEAGIAGARTLPVDDPREGAVVAGEDVI